MEAHAIARSMGLAAAAVLLLTLAACLTGVPIHQPPAITVAPTVTPAADAWLDLLSHVPYPYGAPLPPATSSPLDGVYAKEIMAATPVHCQRCPDYAPYGGVWRLSFDNGVFRVFYAQTRWRSLGSFVVTGDRLQLFNDPNCPETTGTYRWKRNGDSVILEEIADDCAIHLRARNLTGQPWLACSSPSTAQDTGGPGTGQNLCPQD